jgi:uncharacterized coiled-coil protein SlyX
MGVETRLAELEARIRATESVLPTMAETVGKLGESVSKSLRVIGTAIEDVQRRLGLIP